MPALIPLPSFALGSLDCWLAPSGPRAGCASRDCQQQPLPWTLRPGAERISQPPLPPSMQTSDRNDDACLSALGEKLHLDCLHSSSPGAPSSPLHSGHGHGQPRSVTGSAQHQWRCPTPPSLEAVTYSECQVVGQRRSVEVLQNGFLEIWKLEPCKSNRRSR